MGEAEDTFGHICAVTRAVRELRDRAEKAERERDESRTTAETYRSVAGVAERTAEELRAKALDLGNQLVNATDALRTVSQFKANPSTCPSCEGPLTCGRCVPVVPSIDRLGLGQLVDHEARIKELDTLVQAMGERVNDHERRLRAREGKPK